MLNKYNYTCQKCNLRTGNTYNLCVHHKTYERLGQEKIEDLQLLCRKCHDELHRLEFKERAKAKKSK